MPDRIAVDAMGGDHPRGAIIRGMGQAPNRDPDLEVPLRQRTLDGTDIVAPRSHEQLTARFY